MAEVCLAITFSPHGTGVRTDTMTTDDGRRTRRFVLCGKVLPGHRLEVRDEAGKVLGDREVGRIFVAGPSIMPGYFGEPEASREVLSDGWLDTGDLGYTLEGEVVVTGRAKDLIIVNGRNIWPQDIEWAIETRRVVKNGDSVAFSVDGGDGEGGGERVVVAVLARVSGEEGAQDAGQRRGAGGARGDRRRLRRRAGAAVDGPADHLVRQALALARQGQLPGRPLRAQDRRGVERP